MPRRLALPQNRRSWIALILLGWALVACVQALQGYALAGYRGVPQSWWPTLFYAAAIHSVWLLLTWPIIAATLAIQRRVSWRGLRAAAYVALWPVVSALHVLLFAFLYWPLYRSEGDATRWAMADRMFTRNLDTNTLFYVALVGLTIIGVHWRRNAAAHNSRSAPPGDDALVIRSRGRVRRIPLDTIDWIGAAGDYAEIHAASGVHLIEESLTSLAARLPAGAFARIHRGALVRIDRIREIAPIGRGDAHVRLIGGDELRLSRRFRANLPSLLTPARPAE